MRPKKIILGQGNSFSSMNYESSLDVGVNNPSVNSVNMTLSVCYIERSVAFILPKWIRGWIRVLQNA